MIAASTRAIEWCLLRLYRAQHVALGDVRDFVRHHAASSSSLVVVRITG